MGGADRKLGNKGGKSGPVKAVHDAMPGPGQYQVEKKIAIGSDAGKKGHSLGLKLYNHSFIESQLK